MHGHWSVTLPIAREMLSVGSMVDTGYIYASLFILTPTRPSFSLQGIKKYISSMGQYSRSCSLYEAEHT